MKKLLLILIILISTNFDLLSQEFFSAKEGFSKANELIDLERYELTGTGTTRFLSFDIPNVGVLVGKYNIENGTANAWVYAYHNTADDTYLYVGVIKMMYVGIVAIELVDFDISQISYTLDKKIDIEWLDSKSIYENLIKNDDYKEYSISNGFINDFVILDYQSIDELTELLNKLADGNIDDNINNFLEENYYWVSGYSNDYYYELYCFTDAENGETTCFKIRTISVNDDITVNQFHIFPNPASDFINIEINNEIFTPNSKLQIYDINGNLLISDIVNSKTLKINTTELPSGEYMIIIGNSVSKFVIND